MSHMIPPLILYSSIQETRYTRSDALPDVVFPLTPLSQRKPQFYHEEFLILWIYYLVTKSEIYIRKDLLTQQTNIGIV